MGYLRCDLDENLFYAMRDEEILYIGTWVDDLLITGNSQILYDEFKTDIGQHLTISWLGPVSYLLGMKIARTLSPPSLSISQPAYIDSILKRYHMNDATPVKTPMMENPYELLTTDVTEITQSDDFYMDNYLSIIGSLIHHHESF